MGRMGGTGLYIYVPTWSHVLHIRMAFYDLGQSYKKDAIKLHVLQIQPLMCSQSRSLQGDEMLA